MPLKDRDRNRPRRLVRLGVIRLGYKKKNPQGREYPVQADHFVLTDAPEIAALYGEQPRELDIILPFPDIQRNFDASYAVWAGGVLICRGDGEYIDYATPYQVEKKEVKGRIYTSIHSAPGDTLVNNGTAQAAFAWNGEKFQPGDHVPCPGAERNLYPHCAACKVSAILKVMMARPELFRLGYYQIATGSGRNYDTILGTLELIKSSAGHVNGIPFKLRLVKEQTTYREDGQRKRTEKWFLQLEPDPGFTRQLYSQQAARALTGGMSPESEPLQLESGDYDEAEPEAPPPIAEEIVDIETGEIITDEVVWNGSTEEPSYGPEPEAKSPKETKTSRPLDPEPLREFLHKKAAKFGQAGPATEKQIPFVARKFAEAFGGQPEPDKCYHSALKWIWQKDSAKDLTLAEARATLDWLLADAADDTGDVPLHEHAPEEANRILRQALKDAGQAELF